MMRKDPNNAGRVVWALGIVFFFFSFIFLILIIVLLNLCRFSTTKFITERNKKGSNNKKGPKIVSFSLFFSYFLH